MGQSRNNNNNSRGGNRGRKNEPTQPEFDERIIDIARVAKVIKGGRRFAFRVTVVVGDNKGSVGFGIGKARSVPDAIRKALDAARKSMKPVSPTFGFPAIKERGSKRRFRRRFGP